jgi:hypothetical protein
LLSDNGEGARISSFFGILIASKSETGCGTRPVAYSNAGPIEDVKVLNLTPSP